ncbi:MAG: VOC family protein [Pseudomonadales bacterium]
MLKNKDRPVTSQIESTRLRSKIIGLHHVELVVSDIKRSETFYRPTGVEMSVVSAENLGAHGKDRFLLKAPNGCLALRQSEAVTRLNPLPVVGPGVTHACFQAPVQASLYQKLVAEGAQPVSTGSPPIDLNGQGVCYAYARDPDGTMFEVEELEVPKFKGPISLAHIALVSPDIDRAVSFYSQLLGVGPYGRANKVLGPRFDEVTGLASVRIRAAWFNTGNMVLEFWEFINPETPKTVVERSAEEAGYHQFTLETSDLDGEVQRLSALGLLSNAEIQFGSELNKIDMQDPDGNRFSLVETHPDALIRVEHFEPMPWLPAPAWPGNAALKP